MPNITQIPSNRAPIADLNTGTSTREWFLFFSHLFKIAGGGSNATTIIELEDAIADLDRLVESLRLRSTAIAADGIDGEDGQRGAPGPQGIPGPAGQSIPGMDGEDGDDMGLLGVNVEDHSSFGEMTISSNATSLTLTNQNQYYKQTAGWVVGELDDFTFSTDTLICHRNGNYFTACTFTCDSGATNQVFSAGIFLNGSLITDHIARFKLATGTDESSITITGVVSGLKDGDTLDLRLLNTTSAAKTITLSNANFSVIRI